MVVSRKVIPLRVTYDYHNMQLSFRYVVLHYMPYVYVYVYVRSSRVCVALLGVIMYV